MLYTYWWLTWMYFYIAFYLQSYLSSSTKHLANIIIIHIMSWHQRGYPWPSLTTISYRPLLPVSLQGYIPYRYRVAVWAGCPAFARLWERVHKNISLMSLSLLLQQCPSCLVRQILIVFVMSGRWPYSCCFVGCCLQDFLNIAHIRLT